VHDLDPTLQLGDAAAEVGILAHGLPQAGLGGVERVMRG
jgi:hypothetical protein